MFIFIIALAIALVVGLILFSFKKTHAGAKTTNTIITACLAVLLLAVPVLAFWLVAAMAGLKMHLMVPLTGVALVLLASCTAYGLDNHALNKKTVAVLSACALLFAGSILAEKFYRFNYIPSITVSQKVQYKRSYMPFTGSPYLVHTGTVPVLQFAENEELPVVDGATALFPVYCSFVENVYPASTDCNKYVRFDTTTGAYQALTKGEADVVFAARPSKEQVEQAAAEGVTFNLYPIGYEAFVFLVNSKNPVNGLTVQQIKDIYTGKITGWSELGGKNQSIRPFQRDADSGSQTAFVAIMGKDAELLPPETHQVSGMEGLVDVVSDYENHGNAIGYSFRYFVETMHRNKNVKMLNINGVAPTKENIRTHAYPFTDNFYAVTVQGRESENTRRLIEWVTGEQGQEIIEKVGYVSLNGAE